MRAMMMSVLLLAGCAKPLPPPAAATAAVPIDGAAHRLDAVQSNQYLHYAVGVHIDATPERVWSVLTDGANIAQWNSTITSSVLSPVGFQGATLMRTGMTRRH